MYGDARSMLEQRYDSAWIRLDASHPQSDRVARLLEAVDGHRIVSRDEAADGFVTAVARDTALNLVRGRSGWTAAIAFNRRPG